MKLTTGYKKPIASSGTDAQEQSSNNSYLLLAGGGHKALSDFIQNIKVGTVITGNPGTSASVTANKTNSEVTLNFTIPRGYQGDMAEKEDAGYTNSKGDTVVDYCEAILKWQFLSDPGLNYEFVNILQVPIPSYDLITSLIDCIKMNQQVTLAVGDKGQTYTWNQLHWSLQCSNKDNIVYVTKYGTNHTDFYFGVDNNNNGASINAINTIEIIVTCKPGQTDSTVGEYYIQVTVENEYGRAYYTSTKISQIVIT